MYSFSFLFFYFLCCFLFLLLLLRLCRCLFCFIHSPEFQPLCFARFPTSCRKPMDQTGNSKSLTGASSSSSVPRCLVSREATSGTSPTSCSKRMCEVPCKKNYLPSPLTLWRVGCCKQFDVGVKEVY